MADSGSNSLESGSQNSSGGSSGDAAQKKVKAPKVVKSRYMQYDKPKGAKLEKATKEVEVVLLNLWDYKGLKRLKGVPSGPIMSDMTIPPYAVTRSTETAEQNVLFQNFHGSDGNGLVQRAPSNATDGSFKDDLQSTVLDGHKIARPELDFSVINDKTMQKSSPKSLSTPAQRKPKRETTSAVSIPEDTIDMLESQTVIFAYLTMKMQKNIRRLEEKAERSLLLVHDEKMQLQEKVQQLKRELLLNRRKEQLNDLLEKQVESLAPSTAATTQFKSNYVSFATALDCTRHQMPIRDIHITGTRQRFLDDIQKYLDSTKSLLETTPSCDNDMLDTIKNLEDVVHKTDAELSRSLHQVLDLAFKVNKEVSLQSQKLMEESSETEVLRQLYFDLAND